MTVSDDISEKSCAVTDTSQIALRSTSFERHDPIWNPSLFAAVKLDLDVFIASDWVYAQSSVFR
jgi:hypothetical protein